LKPIQLGGNNPFFFNKINFFYRFINKKTLTDLIKKRGTFLGDQNVSELDNALIEEHLGKFNVLCLEDIIFEIQKCGQNFNEVMKFIGFFLLSPCEDVQSKVNINYLKGGAQGFRADKINELLKKMI